MRLTSHPPLLALALLALTTLEANALPSQNPEDTSSISTSLYASAASLLPRAPDSEQKDVHGRVGKGRYSTGRTAGIILGSLALTCAVLIGILDMWPGDCDSCCFCCVCCAGSDAARNVLSAYRNCSSGVKEKCCFCCGRERERYQIRRGCWSFVKEKVFCCSFWDRRKHDDERELRHESFSPARDWNSEFERDEDGYRAVDVGLGYRYVSDGMEPPMFSGRTGTEGQERGIVMGGHGGAYGEQETGIPWAPPVYSERSEVGGVVVRGGWNGQERGVLYDSPISPGGLQEEDIGAGKVWGGDNGRSWGSREEDGDAERLLGVEEKALNRIVVMDLGESSRAREHGVGGL